VNTFWATAMPASLAVFRVSTPPAFPSCTTQILGPTLSANPLSGEYESLKSRLQLSYSKYVRHTIQINSCFTGSNKFYENLEMFSPGQRFCLAQHPSCSVDFPFQQYSVASVHLLGLLCLQEPCIYTTKPLIDFRIPVVTVINEKPTNNIQPPSLYDLRVIFSKSFFDF
jgi:hypothetical protein